MGCGKCFRQGGEESGESIPGQIVQLFKKRTSTIDPGKLRSSWNVHHEVNYNWRQAALCTTNYIYSDETRGRNIAKEDLRKKVQACLSSKAFRTKPPHHPKKYVRWMSKRVELLTKTGGPRMRVVWWKTLKDLGRIPRWPDDKQHVLDLQAILDTWLKCCDSQGRMDGRYLYIWMLSHRWERPHFCDECLTGFCELGASAHPDSITNVKARTMSRWGEHQYDEGNVGPLSPEDHYIWIDFTSIDQEDTVQKLLGIEMLPLYVACCGSGLVLYLPDDGAIGYEERGWTAIERVLAYTYGVSPVLKKIDSGYCKGASRWTSQKLIDDKPEYWEENKDGKLCFRLIDPLKGKLTCDADIQKIDHLKEIIQTTPPIDFNGTKEGLVWDETLCRVDDTCRERSTVMQRGGTRTVPNRQNSQIVDPDDWSYWTILRERFRRYRGCFCCRRSKHGQASTNTLSRRSTRTNAERMSTFQYAGDAQTRSIELDSSICGCASTVNVKDRLKVSQTAPENSWNAEEEDDFQELPLNSIIPTPAVSTQPKKNTRKVSFMEKARPGLKFNSHVEGAGMLKVHSDDQGIKMEKRISGTVFDKKDSVDDTMVASTNSMDWVSNTRASEDSVSVGEVSSGKNSASMKKVTSTNVSRNQWSQGKIVATDSLPGQSVAAQGPGFRLNHSEVAKGSSASSGGLNNEGRGKASQQPDDILEPVGSVPSNNSQGSSSHTGSEDREDELNVLGNPSDSTGCSSRSRSNKDEKSEQMRFTITEPELPGCIGVERTTVLDIEPSSPGEIEV